MKLRNSFTVRKSAFSNIQKMHSSFLRFRQRQEMSIGTKNVINTQEHLLEKSMKDDKK